MGLRNNSEIIKGSSLMVFLNGNPIAFATSHSFSKTLNVNEVSTKDHGDFTANIPGNISWEATTENLYSTNALGWSAINTAFMSKQPVQLAFGPSNYSGSVTSTQQGIVGANGGNTEWAPSTGCEYGEALITSLQVTAAAGDNATFTATFTGNGELSSTPPSPVGPTGNLSPTGTVG